MTRLVWGQGLRGPTKRMSPGLSKAENARDASGESCRWNKRRVGAKIQSSMMKVCKKLLS